MTRNENDKQFLNAKELSKRWGGTPTARTIDNWRYSGRGINHYLIGGLVKYKLKDVEKYEESVHRENKES